MAHINRIEIVNYLCEGWQPSMGIASWRPLWPANVINLGGASTAVQVPNGGGKTSVTNAILYLLSQDRVLKRRFLERCSPAGMVATHIRVEFAILLDEDLTQRDLMTRSLQECPAETYVIGVCANRDDDNPRFYRYPGFLEEAPASRMEGTVIQFTSATELQAVVKKIRGAQWNAWHTSAEWSKVVGMFMSQEVVRQNVHFHREGAGDASAAFSKVAPGPGERFDEAYFRQVVAPQLLTNVMGDSAEEGERSVEDTILNSMGRFIDAKLQVESKQAYLERRAVLEVEFQPVVEAAGKIQIGWAEYQTQLQKLAVDAAFLVRYTDSRDARMPGVPRPLGEFTLGAEVRDCLKSMVLDKDGSILIESAGLAGLLGLSTSHLNQLAGRGSTTKEMIGHHPTSSQVVDLYCDSKFSGGHGGRRNALRYYGLQAARELAFRRAGDSAQPVSVLEQAFEFASNTVDTNSCRHYYRKLLLQKEVLKADISTSEREGREAETEKERLEQQVREWQENQGAYQDFCAQLPLIPHEFHGAPSRVPDWLSAQSKDRNNEISQHVERVGRLSPGWAEFKLVRAELGLISTEHQVADLKAERATVERNKAARTSDVEKAQGWRDAAANAAKGLQTDISTTAVQYGLLSEHSHAYDAFVNIFGDVDPLKVGPPEVEQRRLHQQKQQAEGIRHMKSKVFESLQALASAAKTFKELFGEIDPHLADPQRDLDRLLEAQRVADALFTQHQPLANSLEDHLARTGQDPATWIRETDVAHADTLEKERWARTAVDELDRELSALDDIKQVAHPDYVAAHEALAEADVQVTRVMDVILGLGFSKDETLPLLSALGPLLDAPVVPEMTQAESALSVLQSGEHDVPLFLLAPLAALLKRGPDRETSLAASLDFFAGAKSRRIRAILDPQALEEERQDLLQKRQLQLTLAQSAQEEAKAYKPHTDVYRQALRAQDAMKLGSVDKARAAQDELATLEPRLQVARRLVTQAALLALQDAKKFVDAGGHETLSVLGGEIEELAANLVGIEESLAQISLLLTHGAVVAHDGARKFIQGGGHQTLQALTEKRSLLERQLSALEAELPILETRLGTLRTELDLAQERELTFMSTFQMTLSRLERALVFESDGSAAFMERHDEVRGKLERARDALDPLRSISYHRAQAFKDHQGQDEVTLQRLIGEAKSRRMTATAKAQQLTTTVERLEGDIIEMQLATDSLHELAYFLCARRNTVAPFEEDLKTREVGASRAESHAAYLAAESIRVRLLDWRPGQGSFDRAALGALREEVEAIDVARTGKEVAEARKNATRVSDRFEQVRDSFCVKARASNDGGFSEAEIEAIQEARNSEQLAALATIGSRLHEQLKIEQSELEELKHSAVVIESASIETLARLVETSKSNLSTMNSVMARNPNARFTIDADVISTEDIMRLMEDLRDHIEGRKREAKARQQLTRSVNGIDANLGADVRRALIERIFTKPSVQFRHVGMWDGETRPVQPSLSEGQKSALQMLWLIRESEYHLECAVRRHLGGGSKKKLRSRSQRVLFFDGLFSNLTDRTLIDEAFKGLGEADSNLQLVGLIHNPEYRNNSTIFPSFVVGRRVGRRDVDGERSYVRFDDGRPDGSIGLATFMHKHLPAAMGADGG